MACEGKITHVTGTVDTVNVWGRARHPWLPVDRFLLRDPRTSGLLEVRVKSSDAAEVFARLRSRGDAAVQVFVRGRVFGIDLPVMADCFRDIYLEVEEAAGVSLGNALR
jgi:hypothetical protein